MLRGAGASSLGTLAELGVDARSYTDTATDDATTYHYAVVALSQDGDSPRTSAVTATTPPRTPVTPVIAGAPAAPTGLSGTLDGNGGVTLSWTDPNDSAITGYRVLRGADARSLVVITEDTGSATVSYTDAAPTANATHVYAVQARNATGLSQISATFSATTLDPPFGLDAGAFDVALSWRAPDGDGITSYQVLRGANADDMSVIADDTGSAATSYVDAPVTPETTYYYAVRARSAQGLGPASPAHLVTTPAGVSLVLLDDDNLVSQQQQSSDTLVSNQSSLNSTPNSFSEVGFATSVQSTKDAQRFRTGRHPAGYTITEIQAAVIGAVAQSIQPSVHIHADSRAQPGARLHNFTQHTGFATGSTVKFTPTSTVTLSPRTRYWLVFEYGTINSSNSSHRYFLGYTTHRISGGRPTGGTFQDPCGELDWSIESHSHSRQHNLDGSGTGFNALDLSGLNIAVLGSQVDDGSASELECTDTAAATTRYTKIGMGKTAVGAQHGDAHSNDEDWFQVTLEANVEYQFDIFTSIFGFGYSAAEGRITGLYDADGDPEEIFTYDVGPIVNSDRGRGYFTPTAAGVYYLAVAPGSGLGGPSGSVESAQEVPTYGVRVRKADDYPASTSTTGTVTVGGSVNGHFSFDDTDWIRVALTANTRYRFTLTLHGATANYMATIVGVYNSSGTKIANGANAPIYLVTAQSWYTPSDNGDYYVALTTSGRSSDDPWFVTPDYTLSVVGD